MLATVASVAADRETEALLDRARALPPEFAADAMLRIVSDPKRFDSREQRIEIVEDAFRLAALAQMPWPVRGRGFHTDTRPGWQEFAGGTGLNSLDLQARAIQAMQTLDPARLVRLFNEMRPLVLQPGTCQDPLRPRLAHYYTAMLLVARHGFTAEEKRKGEPERFLQERIRAIVSPAQLSGFKSAGKEPTAGMLHALAAALPQVHHDWLGFVYADGDLPESPETARAVRDYIVRSLRGPRCGGRSYVRTVGDVPMPVERFNTYVTKIRPDLQIEPIDAAKLEPSRTEDPPKVQEFWQSAQSKQILDDLRWLNHGNRNLPDDKRFWTVEERRSPEWNERYLALLKRMEGWSAEDEASPADYFHMRAHVYQSLTRLVPPGTQRTNAFRNFISWLNGAYNDRVPHAEWFTHVKHVLGEAKSEPWLLDEMERYGNAVLSMEALLTRYGLRAEVP
jgi:hypothetical protein